MSVLALCPSRERPGQAAETLASFLATRADPESRLVFVVDSDDPTLPEYPADHVHVVPPTGTMGGALKLAASDQALLGDATVAGMIGDDNRFVSRGWDVAIAGALARPGIAYGDDGFKHERLPTSWWVSRALVDAFGMTEPGLRHYYMDNYWLELGQGAGCITYLPDVRIEHLHPLAGKGSDDAIYRRNGRHAAHDRAWFARWQRRDKAAHIQRAISIVRAGEPRRVLADWHHPALWESLEILFEDRFGWELYAPIGTDWQRLGWRAAGATPGWTADDYLVYEDAVPVGDHHWERRDPEYPERVRKMVTAAQFESQRWDYIVASVPAHQRPFAALAYRHRARLINHVGDAHRPVDRSLRGQVILASANVRGATVVHHQEFDRRLFRYTEPTQPAAVSSFMLRLSSTSCPYTWLSEAPGVQWAAVEAESPRDPGYLAPMRSVASRMQATGWVWHDKRIGDGYGHVLFNAAAVGRPLIGHASHYRGLLGERLWEDMRTCIDLDRHDEREALRLWRAISADPEWHADLSANIRARFEELVDFDAEAQRIKAVLA